MSSKASSSLKELRGLREAVLAEEKAKAQARMQNLPEAEHRLKPNPPEGLESPATPEVDESKEDIITQGNIVPLKQIEQAEAPPQRTIPSDVPAQPATSNRPKTSKEPALIIPLTPKILDRLKRNVENARWSPAELVIELIRSALHQGYPAIHFGDQLVARHGTYRTFERNPLDNSLRIVSGQGVFCFTVTMENSDFQHWLAYFARQKSEDPEKLAQQVCLFGLQSYLESVDDFKPSEWLKKISVENYSILPTS